MYLSPSQKSLTSTLKTKRVLSLNLNIKGKKIMLIKIVKKCIKFSNFVLVKFYFLQFENVCSFKTPRV